MELREENMSLKGLSHEIDFKYFDKNIPTELDLSKGRGLFLNIWGLRRFHKMQKVYLKGPKHDQIECGFFYINPTSMGW